MLFSLTNIPKHSREHIIETRIPSRPLMQQGFGSFYKWQSTFIFVCFCVCVCVFLLFEKWKELLLYDTLGSILLFLCTHVVRVYVVFTIRLIKITFCLTVGSLRVSVFFLLYSKNYPRWMMMYFYFCMCIVFW